MANEEHLAILRQGVEVWNQWRKENGEVQPDLRNISLQNANLHNCNFAIPSPELGEIVSG